jgi:hypothetical protein
MFLFVLFMRSKNHSIHNMFLIIICLNPAVTGIENYTDVKLGHRSQWTGLEGAPVTATLL